MVFHIAISNIIHQPIPDPLSSPTLQRFSTVSKAISDANCTDLKRCVKDPESKALQIW